MSLRNILRLLFFARCRILCCHLPTNIIITRDSTQSPDVVRETNRTHSSRSSVPGFKSAIAIMAA